MQESNIRNEALATLSRLIRDFPVGMLTTCLPDHTLNSRPMVNVNRDFKGYLWFFTHVDDPKVTEVRGNPQVNVSFANPSERAYVSLSGTAELVDDRKHAELLWTADCARWFPDGLADPKLALLKIDVQRAEYWDETTNTMRALTGLFSKQESLKHQKIDWQESAPTPGVGD